MSIRVYAYECAYCGVLKKTRLIAERHEITCLSNPNSRNCLKCKYSYTDENYTSRCHVTGRRCMSSISAYCEFYEEK